MSCLSGHWSLWSLVAGASARQFLSREPYLSPPVLIEFPHGQSMNLRLGIPALLLILVLLLWLTAPASPWSQEGFFTSAAAAPVTARYIQIKHTVPACINLGEIRAYSYQGGPNLITPSTVVTKSSAAAGDAGASRYLVDRNVDSILHTACNGTDVPSLEVDLGKPVPLYAIHVVNRRDCCRNRAIGLILTLLDEQKKPVYVSEPIKDKEGKTTYLDTPAQYTNLTTDYPATLTWYPPQPVAVWDQTDEDDLAVNMICRNVQTPWNEEGGGNAVYLDRHDVRCGPNETVKGFRLVREVVNGAPTGKYRYDYECCQGRVPRPAPLSADQQGVPSKLASLESEVKRIQTQLSSSAAAAAAGSYPRREEVTPQNRQSAAGATAASLGRQSNLLRDIQELVRNEIRNERSTSPAWADHEEEC